MTRSPVDFQVLQALAERPPAPSFSLEQLARAAQERFGLRGELTRLESSIDQNVRLRSTDGRLFVLKVANLSEAQGALDLQNHVMACLAERVPGVAPSVVPSLDGQAIEELDDRDGRPHALRVVTFMEGPLLADALVEGRVDRASWRGLGSLLGRVDAALAELEHPQAERVLRWDLARAAWILERLELHTDAARRSLLERVALQFLAHVAERLDELPAGLIHGDANEHNLVLANASGPARVAALIDFGDSVRTARVFDLAIASAYALLAPGDSNDTLSALAAGYDTELALSDVELSALWPATLMRLAVSVTVSTLDSRVDPHNAYLVATEEPAWRALERSVDRAPGAVEDLLRAACGRGSRPAPALSKAAIAQKRARHLGSNLSLSYATPLEIVRGRGVFLFDEAGRGFLDCVNNVCHVGHCHPRVVAALSAQAAELNTNTRYLHENVVLLAERLTALLPAPLEVCFFVNSGSEANEVALRLARAATGREDFVVLEGGYHGHTSRLVDLSPYKHGGPGGQGAPAWVHVVPLPDGYRGLHRGADDATGVAYAAHVRAALVEAGAAGRPVAAFLAESIVGCGGQVVPPPGFLRAAYAHARAAGSLCIADEVQVGFGRVGTHWWAFEQHGVVPDIVTLGKPMGNGHPLAAVVTTRAIADAFVTGMEFFSTYGGNPVSAAVGLAVLDVLADEDLRANALARGAELRAGFLALATRHPSIGEVRGSGLYLGVAIVRDRASREPAPEVLAHAVELARQDGVLLSIDGPLHDVLKLKPPLVFDAQHVRLLLGTFERALDAAERHFGIT